jgi:hypothetical protein
MSLRVILLFMGTETGVAVVNAALGVDLREMVNVRLTEPALIVPLRDLVNLLHLLMRGLRASVPREAIGRYDFEGPATRFVVGRVIDRGVAGCDPRFAFCQRANKCDADCLLRAVKKLTAADCVTVEVNDHIGLGDGLG